jgi:hypothetical protein
METGLPFVSFGEGCINISTTNLKLKEQTRKQNIKKHKIKTQVNTVGSRIFRNGQMILKQSFELNLMSNI